jgi:hypothetical protein
VHESAGIAQDAQLLQVVEVSSWLTSNARLLMEVGAEQAAAKNVSISTHRGAGASHKPTGFHSDQVGALTCHENTHVPWTHDCS